MLFYEKNRNHEFRNHSDSLDEPYPVQEKKEGGRLIFVERAYVTLSDGISIYIPYWRIDSGKEGPSLLLMASQHGNEVQGAEVAKRFMEICSRQLVTGTVWIVPVANMPALQKRRHSINLGTGDPVSKARIEDQDMNLIWPGKSEGNDTERMVWSLYQTVLRYCNYLVDIHCWNHFTAAETTSVNDNERSFPLGEVTTTRFISYSPTPKMNMASQAVRKYGGGAIEIELSGQFMMLEDEVQTGLSSLVNIAKLLGMMKGKPRLLNGKRAVRNGDTSHDVMAPSSGLFVPAKGKDKFESLKPGDHINKGDLLGHIIDQKNLDEIPVLAPFDGYLWQLGACHSGLCDQSLQAQHPYVEADERIALVVSV
jgi:predicted deacylase